MTVLERPLRRGRATVATASDGTAGAEADEPGTQRFGVPAPGGRTRTGLRVRAVVLALVLLAAVLVFAVVIGSGELGWQSVLAEMAAQVTGTTSPLSEREAAIVWQLRAPRVVLAGVVGAALAGAGAAFQGVFRNPLADPYLLGAAAGAGMGATAVMVLAPAVTGWIIGPIQLAAFAGALAGVGLSWLLGRSAGTAAATLLLAGVAVTAFLTAIQTFVQQLNTATIDEVYTWTMGGLNVTGWDDLWVTLPYAAVAAVVLCASARLLDVLALGDAEATSLGLRPGRVRLAVLGAASLATAAAVAVAGLIGFVGIVVPHVVRLLVGASYRVIVPLSLLGGATFLILADYVARTLMPGQLPLGVVTAFAGAPFFALVLRTTKGQAR